MISGSQPGANDFIIHVLFSSFQRSPWCPFNILFLKNEPEKNLVTFHYTGWFIGILTMAYYNPYIIG